MYSYLALVLLQRIFDQPLVGIIALTIVAVAVLANVPITKWRIPPFLVAWLIPLAVGLAVGYVHPVWQGISLTLPFVKAPRMFEALSLALPYLSVIAPMAIYQILQDIAPSRARTQRETITTPAKLSPATALAHLYAAWQDASLRRSSMRCTRLTKRWARESVLHFGPP